MRPRGIAAIAAAEPGRPALLSNGEVMTFGALDARANAVAHALAEVGVSQGDRVAVMLGNRPEVFVAWTGAARVGALIVPISYRFTAPEVAYILGDSAALALIHDQPAVADAAASQAGVDAVWAVDDPVLSKHLGEPPTDDFLATPAMWMNYTSGTTGKPKGIQRPVPQPAREAPPSPMAQFWGFGWDDVHLLCGPAYHTAPGAYAQLHLAEGASVVIMGRFDAEECLALIDRHRVTTSHMVPVNFVRILDLAEGVRDRYDLSSVRKILHSAAACPVAVKQRILDVFPPGTIWEYYGASEGMGTVVSPREWLERPGTVGRAFPGLEVRILDDNGAELPPGEVGTIYISAVPGYEFAYHNAPDKTAAAWQGGHFTVGDLGWRDADGYLYIADRRTDLIIRGGVNVYPAEVEAALAEHPDVVDSAVIGLPDEGLGQRVHAIVELRAGAAEDADALQRFLAERLADFKRPAAIEFVARLPREPNGKVLKGRLQDERSGA